MYSMHIYMHVSIRLTAIIHALTCSFMIFKQERPLHAFKARSNVIQKVSGQYTIIHHNVAEIHNNSLASYMIPFSIHWS